MNQFKIQQITSPDNPFFKEFWRIYVESFPLYERRDFEQQVEILNKPGYQLELYILEDNLIGLISFWKSDEFIFVEHLAISPDFQGKGLGRTLLRLFSKNQTVPVILEIEPPVNETTTRRLRFYESLGFVTNSHLHFQPPFHVGDNPLPLNILTYPIQIDHYLYIRFSQFQKRTMMLL
ncbi:MAG: GNAT family N-acetyltransferase [Mariniphaga sp.]